MEQKPCFFCIYLIPITIQKNSMCKHTVGKNIYYLKNWLCYNRIQLNGMQAIRKLRVLFQINPNQNSNPNRFRR